VSAPEQCELIARKEDKMAIDASPSSDGASSSAVVTSHHISRWGKVSVAALAKYLEKRRTRRALSELSNHQLLDIGLTQAQAHTEVSKSWFWG
jgi:uncharacterized protein YjiS (DUF1127 family)